MSLHEIELVHLGGERRTVPVVGFDGTTIWFTWPMAGVYRIRVRTNEIVGMKGRWKAADHERLREIHRTLSSERTEVVMMRRHG